MRFVNYQLEVDPENFYREQVLLYTNWREEPSGDLKNINEENISSITACQNLFYKYNYEHNYEALKANISKINVEVNQEAAMPDGKNICYGPNAVLDFDENEVLNNNR